MHRLGKTVTIILELTLLSNQVAYNTLPRPSLLKSESVIMSQLKYNDNSVSQLTVFLRGDMPPTSQGHLKKSRVEMHSVATRL